MIKTMKKLLIIFGLLMLTNAVFGQEKKYNLPPNQILNPKAKTNLNYSYKLSEIAIANVDNYKEANFLYEISEEEMNIFKSKDLNTYNYYLEANNFYNKLSKKVKVVYSVDELWDIYIFDEELTKKLTEIK